MTLTSTTKIATTKASGYLQQLCKHFGHKTEFAFTPLDEKIPFGFGTGVLQATGDTFAITAEAHNNRGCDKPKHVINSHLERVSFREDLTINWDN
ncbi:DUF2218 domain-containing protein [Shimia sp. Alg240-R146]|uniref:DUF2218 domain-containing protein n=1 Tax=Shimia sp. Alg240-R146 TaxID=2993449 RepID=UPI0022E597FB|nr:DUF2218 domain-containing protein [Shimia sp. Alg240-R146]